MLSQYKLLVYFQDSILQKLSATGIWNVLESF